MKFVDTGAARVIGPCPVDFTDFPGATPDGAKFDIVTFPVGTVVLAWWVRPSTYVMWHATGGDIGDGYLGQGLTWDPTIPQGQWGEPFATGRGEPWADAGANSIGSVGSILVTLPDGTEVVGTVRLFPFEITDAAPVQAWWLDPGDAGGALTAGHSDLMFLVALPAAP